MGVIKWDTNELTVLKMSTSLHGTVLPLAQPERLLITWKPPHHLPQLAGVKRNLGYSMRLTRYKLLPKTIAGRMGEWATRPRTQGQRSYYYFGATQDGYND